MAFASFPWQSSSFATAGYGHMFQMVGRDGMTAPLCGGRYERAYPTDASGYHEDVA